MAEISSINTVRVTLSATPKGLSEANTASIVIFTNEEASKSGEYFAPMSPSEVADIFGSDSRTFSMANAILGQTPNIRTARGSLYIVPYVAVDATRGNLVTPNIKANLANFKTVTNGALTISVNGKQKTVKNLNFTGCATAKEIAEVINNANLDVEVIGTDATDSATITFASKLVGETSSVIVTAGVGGTDISGSTYLSAEAGVVTQGTNSSATETLAEAIAKDIRNGMRTDTVYYEELRQLHRVMDKMFGDFVDSHYSDVDYNCSEYVPNYEEIHTKAIADTSHYRDELLHTVFNEKDFEKKCIYAREFAYANWHNMNGNAVDVVAITESLFLTTEYSPILCDLWLMWRTALQGSVLSGISNDSSMYNIFYNGMRRRIAYRYITRLNENPNDELAFSGLMKLIYRSSIVRNSGCYVGNNCFLDQMELYEECRKN